MQLFWTHILKLKIITKNSNDPNNPIYLDAVKYFLRILLNDVDYEHVERIDIKVDSVMSDFGECFIRKLKNKKITVRIKVKKGLSFIQTLLTLAHESTHAEQFITKRLVIAKSGMWYWNNNAYGEMPYLGLKQDEIYDILPWEREAVYKETELFLQYMNYYIESNS